jgi:hypothetical protein
MNEELRRLAEAATPGPWKHGPLFGEVWRTRGNALYQRVAWVKGARSRQAARVAADAAYIAAANPATILALLDELDALRVSHGVSNAPDFPKGGHE